MKHIIGLSAILFLLAGVTACNESSDVPAEQAGPSDDATASTTAETADAMPNPKMGSLAELGCPASPDQEGPQAHPEFGPPYDIQSKGAGWLIDQWAMVHVAQYVVTVAGPNSSAERAWLEKMSAEYTAEAAKVRQVNSLTLTFNYLPISLDANGNPVDFHTVKNTKGAKQNLMWFQQQKALIDQAEVDLNVARATLDTCTMFVAQRQYDTLRREYDLNADEYWNRQVGLPPLYEF